ncbi:glycine-rich domain-containing protein [Nostoc cycadae]|uniref:Glycine-rich domain-containing protein-like n=1 Tax=Nostoc cycadae WK-1 TaxID=1861711 RepID=A0A2H6LR40_9NOSO|nr:glycine-rich domain-containing protein-like [Nostoc cycadae]GBE95670.1 hypothetical protein NCWK1_5458 [Nostoc cycadae WK-1]
MFGISVNNESKRALLPKFENLDLESIIVKLTHPKDIHKWSREKAEYAVSQYKKFLFLNALYPEQELVPTIEIDNVWHVHILDTEKYRNDCQYLFGRFLDHYPYSGLKGQQDEKEHLNKFKLSQTLLQELFPSDDVTFSKIPAHSSSTSSASFSSVTLAYSSSNRSS